MSDALATREEIAEIIHSNLELHMSEAAGHPLKKCAAREVYLKLADALLARLRPAWEALKAANGHEHAALDSIEGLDATNCGLCNTIDDNARLRADLRACAEALVQYGQHKPTCPVNGDGRFSASAWLVVTNPQPCDCGLATALARPGVREALT